MDVFKLVVSIFVGGNVHPYSRKDVSQFDGRNQSYLGVIILSPKIMDVEIGGMFERYTPLKSNIDT